MPANPPDEPPDFRRLRQEVEGYLELDLPDMAEVELTGVPGSWTEQPLVLDGWLAVMMHRRSWTRAVETGLRGCAAAPGQPSFFIHTAFCLHELGRTEEAHLLLASGPDSLRREPLFHYNMGCYLAMLGRAAEASEHLNEAFRLDASLRNFARCDRDLEAIWSQL